MLRAQCVGEDRGTAGVGRGSGAYGTLGYVHNSSLSSVLVEHTVKHTLCVMWKCVHVYDV